jgi:hypothetical protein
MAPRPERALSGHTASAPGMPSPSWDKDEGSREKCYKNYRCARYTAKVWVLNTAAKWVLSFLTLRVSPDAMVEHTALHLDTLWTLYLHSEGTPLSTRTMIPGHYLPVQSQAISKPHGSIILTPPGRIFSRDLLQCVE